MTHQTTALQHVFTAIWRSFMTAVGLTLGSLATLVIFRGFTSLS